MNHMQLKTPEERQAIVRKSVATRRANKEKRDKAREDALTYADGLRIKIIALEQRLATLDHTYKLSTVSAKLTNKALLQAEEITMASLPWQNLSGIYFLVQDEQVVYVGQSTNVYSRIAYHVGDKTFEKYAFVPCDIDLLDKLESLYIHALRPKLNGNMNSQEKNAPIRFDKLINMI